MTEKLEVVTPIGVQMMTPEVVYTSEETPSDEELDAWEDSVATKHGRKALKAMMREVGYSEGEEGDAIDLLIISLDNLRPQTPKLRDSQGRFMKKAG